MHSFALESLP
jgi:preprotein translocase subunit SecD